MRKFLIRAGLVALLLLAIVQGVMMGRDTGPAERSAQAPGIH